jgi:hypothetical protein
MKTTESENTFTNVDLLDKQDSSNNYTFEHIENTPFTIVTEGNEHFGLIGNHRITESYENKETLKEELVKFSWDRVAQVIWAVVEKFKNEKNN